MRMAILRLTFSALVYFVFDHSCASGATTYSFNADNTNTRCGSRTSKFWSNLNVPLSQCITECGRRPKCLALNHRSRYSNFCELLDSTNVVTSEPFECTYLTREDIDLSSVLTNGCGCAIDGSCDLATNTCTKSECSSVRTINNGQIFGNRFSIGDSFVIKCNQGFEPVNGITRATCLHTGDWDNTPTCMQKCSPPTISHGSLSGNTFTVGNSYAVLCNTGYEETNNVDSVTCLSPGIWDYAPECVSSNGTCDNNWVQYGTSCFYVSTSSDGNKNFDTSQSYCVNLGGHLARLDSYEKFDVVRNKINLVSNAPQFYWIGLRQYSNNGAFKWIDANDAASYTEFDSGQPEANSENCAMMWEGNWKWHDGYCYWTSRFVCERPST